jgi:hypothetical protein
MLKDAARVKCPLCSGSGYARVKTFVAHLNAVHADQLWLEDEADSPGEAREAVQEDVDRH